MQYDTVYRVHVVLHRALTQAVRWEWIWLNRAANSTPPRVTPADMFINHRRRAGVGQFRLHDLRHFMATEMLAHGVAVVTVSQRLGHARSSTTLNAYGHCVPGADRDAANYIAQLLTSK